MKGKFTRELSGWLLTGLLAGVGIAAFVIVPVRVMGGEPTVSADCLIRENAHNKILAVEWLGSEEDATYTYSLSPALTQIDVVGRVKCGANSERYVEWHWLAGANAPTVEWYEGASEK